MSLIDFGLGGGKSSGSQQQGVWGLQAPYLQALYQMAFNQSLGQMGLPGGSGPGGAPDPVPIRPIPSPGHSGKGAIKQYNQELAAWQARNPGGAAGQPAPQQGQAGWQMGMPSGAPGINGGSGNPAGSIGDYAGNLAGGLFAQAQGQSPYLQQQIGNLGQNIAQFWNQQILPGIANDAGGAGQYGGSRQGIAQGMGAQQALQSFQQGATDLYANNWNTGAQRATDLYNLGMAPWSAQFAPLQAFGGLLGSPTILGSGSQASWNASASGGI